jgi:8-oxo-dGTP pyrophosphatase MutT (NUDIX family)
MNPAATNVRVPRISVISAGVRIHPPAKSVRLSQISKLRECEQVAAVCYRVRRGSIEFLLVQTRGSRRWIFPKGSAEPGLTHAQAAAIEAFEEAGVHGRIEEAAFLRYVCRGQRNRSVARAGKAVFVSAHLCEVRRLCNPKECNRNRTWFSVEDTKRRLREGRKDDDGEEFARVVQQAVVRIEQMRIATVAAAARPKPHAAHDELYRVQFEASIEPRRRSGQAHRITAPAGRSHNHEMLPCEVLPFATPRNSNRASRLLASGVKVKALGAGLKNG